MVHEVVVLVTAVLLATLPPLIGRPFLGVIVVWVRIVER
jgi:hypothetical protein